jgi:hypothetical protein
MSLGMALFMVSVVTVRGQYTKPRAVAARGPGA